MQNDQNACKMPRAQQRLVKPTLSKVVIELLLSNCESRTKIQYTYTSHSFHNLVKRTQNLLHFT